MNVKHIILFRTIFILSTVIFFVGNASESTTSYSEEDWARMLATQREQEAKQDLKIAQKEEEAKYIKLMSKAKNSIETSLKDAQEQIRRGKELMQTKQNKRDPAEDKRLILSVETFLKDAQERIKRGDELNAKWVLTQAEERIKTLEKNHPADAKALKNKLIAVKEELEPNKKSEPSKLTNFLKGLYDKLFK